MIINQMTVDQTAVDLAVELFMIEPSFCYFKVYFINVRGQL